MPGPTLLPLPEPPGSAFAISQRRSRSSHRRASLPGDSGSTYRSNAVFLLELADPSMWRADPTSASAQSVFAPDSMPPAQEG